MIELEALNWSFQLLLYIYDMISGMSRADVKNVLLIMHTDSVFWKMVLKNSRFVPCSFSAAVILALLSMFWVRPDKAYFTYIDFRTLGLLFCLMAIVAGLKAVGVFDILAKKLLMGTSGTVGVIRLLVLLCFFLSMVITNDVALITFVPPQHLSFSWYGYR